MLPLKEYLYIGAVLGLLFAGGWFTHHERTVGEQRVIAAQNAADKKYLAIVNKVQSDAKVQTDSLQKQLDDSLLTPVHPNVVVRMLSPSAAPGTVRPDAGSGGGSNGPGGPGGGLGENDQGVDVAPATEQILARDKALIAYLQGYIRECQTAGMCRKE